MDTDLIQVARTLAERGWLPGIGQMWYEDDVSEADLLLAAHREIVRKCFDLHVYGHDDEDAYIEIDIGRGRKPITSIGTTTLSLLRCLLAACEAAEKGAT